MLKNMKRREEYLFLTAYSLWMLDALLGITTWNTFAGLRLVGDCMQKLAYVILSVQFVNKRCYTKKDVTGILLIVASAGIAYHSIYNKRILYAMIFIYFAAEVDWKKILRHTCILQGSFMLITGIAALTGVIENMVWGVDEGRERYALGYTYCSYPAHLLLFLTILWMESKERVRMLDCFVLACLNVMMYLVTDTRTDCILALLLLGGYMVIALWTSKKKTVRLGLLEIIAKYGFGLVTVFSVLLHALFEAGNPVWDWLNEILNGRLRLGRDAITQYGFSLFGRAIKWYGGIEARNDPSIDYNYVDCAYLKLLLEAGAVVIVAWIIGYYLLGRRLAREQRYLTIWSFFILLIYGIVQPQLFNLCFCPFLLALSILLRRQESDEQLQLAEAFAAWRRQYIKDSLCEKFRVCIMLGILIFVTFVQLKSYVHIVKYASMYQALLGLLILVLAACMWKENRTICVKKDSLAYVFFGFLVLAILSDFLVKKHFVYAAFGLLFFGSIVLDAWKGMENPCALLHEFKIAYKIYFAGSILLCLVTRPMVAGQCYNGLYANPSDQAVAMLIAYVLFLLDCAKKKGNMLNAMGAVLSLYLLYRSGQPILLGVAMFATICNGLCRIRTWKRVCVRKYMLGLFCGCFAGVLLVFGLHYVLREQTQALGMCLTYDNEQVETFAFGGAALLSTEAWIKLFSSIKTNFISYTSSFNWIGHAGRKKIKKVRRMAQGSLLINFYRYGIVAGIAYCSTQLLLFKRMMQGMRREEDREMAILGVAIVLASMVAVLDYPFLHIGWFVYYLVMGYFLVRMSELRSEGEAEAEQ